MLILLQYTPVRSSWGAIGTKMPIYQVPAVNKNKTYKLVYNCIKLFFFNSDVLDFGRVERGVSPFNAISNHRQFNRSGMQTPHYVSWWRILV